MIARLAHYAVRASDLAVSSAFYVEVLGLRPGPRPPFGFPGVWLYLQDDCEPGSQGCVHLIGSGETDALADDLGDRPTAEGCPSRLDHIAFLAVDWPACRDRLTRLRAPFTERVVPQLNVRQIFVTDPDGVTLELNFPADA